ncbi:glycosyltransferase [Nocardia sp. NPDC058499]|uniref:glycosyltransferase n=1 Tax=Nocardia sp. NPDC058499 TaxID=3346530 RepID=UPI0036496922
MSGWVPGATNGGYGGVQHALRYGIPLIVAGETADKAEVAARVAYTHTGIDLGTAYPTPAAIHCAVDRILADPSYRTAAHRLRDQFRMSLEVYLRCAATYLTISPWVMRWWPMSCGSGWSR